MAAVNHPRETFGSAGQRPTDNELRAYVRDYFSMLEGELRGRAARAQGFGRPPPGDEDPLQKQTYCQIAAILTEEGLPFHSSYRPLLRYPDRLRAMIETYLRNHPEIFRLMESDVDEAVGLVPPVEQRGLENIASRPPEPGDIPEISPDDTSRTAISGIDYLAQEQRNSSLARAGELFVLDYEINRLREAGAMLYADAVEHVASEFGGGGGYDIHSYDADGRDRYIKVKTTRYRRETPFFVTANEIALSATHREHFWLYRVFDFRSQPRLYAMNGSLSERFRLQSIAYRAIPR